MATTLTIGGSPVTLSARNSWPRVLSYDFGGYSSLVIERRGGPLQALPDPWLGKQISLSIGGVVYFQGDVTDADPHYTDIGWVTSYQCRDLKARCDRVPMTDSNTLTDAASYNGQLDDPLAIPSRQGRTAGQIIQDVLTMTANATALNARGVGAYTSMGPPPVLPASTLADLAAMTVIPPNGCVVQGEKLISAIESFARQWAPNHYLWIEPATGAIRLVDQRTLADHTLTMEIDPIEPTALRRSVGDCFQRVVVRGMPVAERKVVSVLDGGLQEHFDYGSVSNAAAKAAWTPQEAVTSSTAKSEGTCSCTDTLDVVVDPADALQAWPSNFWDQSSTGHQGQIDLWYTGGAGLTQSVSRRIVSNAALTAGGTANCVMDLALPIIAYNKYKIYGVSNGLGWCWKRYKVTDPTVAAAMTRQLTYPAPWVGSNGGVAVMTSYPMGSVCWSSSGSPPFEERPAAFTFDPVAGNIYFLQATYISNGNRVPSDVRALLAVNTGSNVAAYPADVSGSPVYAGTSNSVEGMTETLTVTCLQWRDPANLANMVAYAHDLHDSVKDTIVSGTVVYHGLYLTALQAGQSISVAGSAYTTGYEGLKLPIRAVELHWEIGQGRAVNYTTVMQLSNRRAHYTADSFLRPDRPIGGQQFDWGALDWTGIGHAQAEARDEGIRANVGMGREIGLGAMASGSVFAGGGVDPASGIADPTAGGIDPMSGAADPLAAALMPEQPGAGVEMAGLDLGRTGDGGNVSGRYAGRTPPAVRRLDPETTPAPIFGAEGGGGVAPNPVPDPMFGAEGGGGMGAAPMGGIGTGGIGPPPPESMGGEGGGGMG